MPGLRAQRFDPPPPIHFAALRAEAQQRYSRLERQGLTPPPPSRLLSLLRRGAPALGRSHDLSKQATHAPSGSAGISGSWHPLAGIRSRDPPIFAAGHRAQVEAVPPVLATGQGGSGAGAGGTHLSPATAYPCKSKCGKCGSAESEHPCGFAADGKCGTKCGSAVNLALRRPLASAPLVTAPEWVESVSLAS